MEFSEKRYSQKMIDEFTKKQKLAEMLGGDVEYFKNLVEIWKVIHKELTPDESLVE